MLVAVVGRERRLLWFASASRFGEKGLKINLQPFVWAYADAAVVEMAIW